VFSGGLANVPSLGLYFFLQASLKYTLLDNLGGGRGDTEVYEKSILGWYRGR
jgi:hypothetical protein